ncbi:MAG: hypothetical protein JWM39_518 [Parcubacteria group bacterium]|nr:hypothetical protein [Parcubacteria group bacterium]
MSESIVKTIEYGTVTDFDSTYSPVAKGFIVPDVARSGVEYLHFFWKNISRPEKDTSGQIILIQLENGDTFRIPEKGDRLAYTVQMHSKGPIAIQWCFEEQITQLQ